MNTNIFICAKICQWYFTYINSSNPHNNTVKQIAFILFVWWVEKMGIET